MTGSQLDDLVADPGDIMIAGGEDDGPRPGAIKDRGLQEPERLRIEAVEKFIDHQQARVLNDRAGKQ